MTNEKKLEIARYILTCARATDDEVTETGQTGMHPVYREWEQQWRKVLIDNCADLKEYFGWMRKAMKAA